MTDEEMEDAFEQWGDDATAHKPCPRCKVNGPVEVVNVEGQSTAHHWKLISACCKRYIKWLPKPVNKAQKRPKVPRDERFNESLRAICEVCFRPEEHLKKVNSWLEVHHVIPVEDGGTDEAWNLRVYCIQCHRQCHSRRREMKQYLTKMEAI
jgi:hypothetical protein